MKNHDSQQSQSNMTTISNVIITIMIKEYIRMIMGNYPHNIKENNNGSGFT